MLSSPAANGSLRLPRAGAVYCGWRGLSRFHPHLAYEVTGRIARITLNGPERGNGIAREMPGELAACVERANLHPDVHVIALAGRGKGFCGGYELVASAERRDDAALSVADAPPGSPLDPAVLLANHTLMDGAARHTREGYAFQQRAAEAGFKQAVRERDEPFGDFGPSTFKG